jgi:hypothetical protein
MGFLQLKGGRLKFRVVPRMKGPLKIKRDLLRIKVAIAGLGPFAD